MAESLILFESVINSRWFLRTSIILFLNKIDVFKTKLPKVRVPSFPSSVSSHPVRSHWNDISQNILVVLTSTRLPNTFCGDLCKRIVHVFRSTLSTCRTFEFGLWLTSAISLTQATDTTNIRLVFAAVKETILQNALKDSGIL